MSTLYVSPDAPALVRDAAAAILILHIGGGGLGLVSGATALLARKGERLHRVAGTVFFGAMATMATIGAGASPFLPVPEMANVVAGILTLYLLATSWVTIRRKDGAISGFETGGFFVALGVFAAGLGFIAMAMNSPTGTVGKTPPEAFYVFVLVGAIAAACDLKVVVQGEISGAGRIGRHLWRMCVALTIASGSFFLGQQKFLPVALHGSPLLFIPVFAPLLLMAFWLIRIRLRPARRRRVEAVAA